MLIVVGDGMSLEDRKLINGILSSAKIMPDQFELKDAEIDNYDINVGIDQVLTIGKKATKAVVRYLVSNGVLSATSFLGHDIYDEDHKFFLYHTPDVSVFMSSPENKAFVWDKIVKMKGFLDLWNSPVDKAESKDSLPQEGGKNTTEMITNSKEKEIEGPAEYTLIEVDSALATVYEQVELNGHNLGKTLSKFDRFSFSTNEGEMNVYPSGRIPSSDETGISLRDLITLLKSARLFNSDEIKIYKNGNSSDMEEGVK